MSISALPPGPELIALLSAYELPTEDIPGQPALRFFGYRANGELQGVVGLELHGPNALLRSLAVQPQKRQRGLGKALVLAAEEQARLLRVRKLFLLTTTAQEFFTHLGYTSSPRDSAPPSIRQTAQFGGLCPSSAAFMDKPLAPSAP